ncbi:Terpene cyclase/mutase family member [Psidium guajava]|nr:Terpene cyclase/mutase family member [Psidium guajava]
MLQEVPPAVYPDNFAFDLPQGRLTKETKTLYQAKIDLIIHTLKNSPLQDVEWPDYLDEEMNVHRASKEYIKMFKEYRQSMVEPYVPDYIVPYLPGVEPYIPEDMGPPPAEEDEDLHVGIWVDQRLSRMP